MKKHFAFPLFSLVDRQKIDPETSDLRGLAEQLGKYLAHNFSINAGAVSIEGVAKNAAGDVDLFLLLADVPAENWPAAMALADVQKAQLFSCEFAADADGTGRFTLTPLKSA